MFETSQELSGEPGDDFAASGPLRLDLDPEKWNTGLPIRVVYGVEVVPMRLLSKPLTYFQTQV